MTDGYLPPLVVHEGRPTSQLLEQLRALGHFTAPIPADVLSALTPEEAAFQEAVESYQNFHGLKVDGVLGPITEAHMNLPRCGIADVLPASGCVRKWAFADVSYSHRLQFNSMGSDEIHRAFTTACDQWNAVCGLKLTFQQNISTANIWAEAAPIDQAGGTLAWSYLCGCDSDRNVRLQQRYDTRERWTFFFLVAVVCHEIGHAIGLEHSSDSSDLMAPFYNPKITKPQRGDIERVVALYGQPTAPPPVPPQPPLPPGQSASVVVTVGANVYSGSIAQVL